MEGYNLGIEKMLDVTRKLYDGVGFKWVQERMKERREKTENMLYLTLVVGAVVAGYLQFNRLSHEMDNLHLGIEQKVVDTRNN